MKRLLTLLSVLVIATLAVGACQSDEPEQAVQDQGQTVEQQAQGPVDGGAVEGGTAAEEPVDLMPAPAGDSMVFDHEPVVDSEPTLIIGQGLEPASLYIYGGSMLAGTHVLNSIYDGPIEGLDYDFQAVIIEQLPKMENEGSGATLEMVSVEPGARYVDEKTQEVVTATEAMTDLPQITARFTLRDGVTWQDGVPVTADDSVFSQVLACDEDSPTSKVLCERTEHYIAVDEKTTEWMGIPGYTDPTYYTNYYTPLPRHQLGSTGERMDEMSAVAIADDEEFTRRPYSYGPFKIKEWVADDHIELERNEYYWRADEGLPYLDTVVHKFIEDANTLLAALIAGDVDVATQDVLDITQFDALSDAEAKGQITPYYVSGTVWEHIDFNLQPADERIALGACKLVRQAIAFGTDRATMVDEIQEGKTKIQNTFVPDAHWAYPTDLAPDEVVYNYDPEKAKEILDLMGFEDADGDGIREAQEDITCTVTVDATGQTKELPIPAGTPLSLTLNTTSGNEMRQQTTLLFQQNMADIGVDIELDYLAADVFFEKSADGMLTGRRYDLGEFAWLTSVRPPVALYFCDLIPSADNAWTGQNNTGWCNPEYDRLAKQADTTLERDLAVPLYSQAQDIFMDEIPVLPLFARVKVMGTAPGVKNFEPNATVNSETWNIEHWGLNRDE
ncbi:MAG: peptide ABC transporter substrate-binding protein [Anaerolineae bacterium]